MTKDEQFFYDNAGWSYDPKTETSEQGRIRCASDLVRAETHGRENGWYVYWEPDPEPWNGDEPYDGPLWGATLYDSEDGILAALWSIACESEHDVYGRVINAELMLEAIA